jgi:hypothetical protein
MFGAQKHQPTVIGHMVAVSAMAISLVSGCGREVPTFDTNQSFADLTRQTEFGPRVPGTESHAACLDWLKQRLAESADSVWEQPFTGRLHGIADSVRMVNIIARYRSEEATRVLLGAHWDSRPWADRDPDSSLHSQPISGANDGASGVAVLLEIGRVLAHSAPPVGLDIVLFDGEDAGLYGEVMGDWIQGSRHFAQHLPAEYEWVIIVDLVGDRDLSLPREGYSQRLAPGLTGRVWSVADEIGERVFSNYVGQEILDDHMPFLMRGIPAVDIIDIDYAYWHTMNDTPDKCSPASLGAVGRVVLHVIFSE